MFPSIRQRFGFGGWTAVRALPYMDADFKKQLEEAVKSYVAQLDNDLAATPFGVPPSMGRLGRLGRRRRSRRPDVLPAQGISRDRGHGLHASGRQLHAGHASGIEHVVRVGVWAPSSKLKAYGNNRADNTFIPGGVIPGLRHHQAGLSGVHRRLRLPLVRERIRDRCRQQVDPGCQRGRRDCPVNGA